MACEHNLQYWRNFPYLGCGAGGHGYAGGKRTENELNPRKYIQLITAPIEASIQQRFSFPQTPAANKINEINHDQEMKETMMMGLRLTDEGVSRAAFTRRFGVDIINVFQHEIEQLIRSGLLEWEVRGGDRLRLTPRGRLLGNQVFVKFV
jgi:oxygen-independent coproporphyrinogen-3 oxidase